jgi:hypothetical protein
VLAFLRVLLLLVDGCMYVYHVGLHLFAVYRRDYVAHQVC